MSGYSDKEYLKSAIKLKALNYVEKPIELDELKDTLKAAILENSKTKTLNDNIENKIALEIINLKRTRIYQAYLTPIFLKSLMINCLIQIL